MNKSAVSEYVYKEPKLNVEQRAIAELLFCAVSHVSLPIQTEAALDMIDTDTLSAPLNLIVAMFQRSSSLYTGMEVIEASLPKILGDALLASHAKNKKIYNYVKSAPLPQMMLPVKSEIPFEEGKTEGQIQKMTKSELDNWIDRYNGGA
jgi:hypothetical protein